MFLGEHQHSLDAKGRVILPARFRDQLEDGAVMAKALDGCLAVYPVEEFQRVAANLQDARSRGATERQAARSYFSGAVEITPDKQGRVAIPAHLRTFAKLEREVIVAGNFDHIEIWNSEDFTQRDQQGSASIVGGEGIDDFM
jgi:MraZ protein